MNILHISFDIPDDFIPDKTVAIKNLIEASDQIGNYNFYISLNRTNNINYMCEKVVGNKSIQLRKFGWPYGFRLINNLTSFYKELLELDVKYDEFDIIHAHKLTYEGYIGYLLKSKFGTPYVVSIRFTDFKVLQVRRDLIGKYRKVLQESSRIFCVSPWMINKLEKVFGKNFLKEIEDKIEILPNIVKNENYEFVSRDNGKFITIFKVTKKNIKRKNIVRLLEAVKKINSSEENFFLDIIGDGDGMYLLREYIDNNDLNEKVNLIGKINNDELLNMLSLYKAFVLCSYPETFGLVYIEALIKGLPIIYSRNTGVDGYFDEYNIGQKVNYKDVNSIIKELSEVNRNIDMYKKNVKEMQDSDSLKTFRSNNVILNYNNSLINCMKGIVNGKKAYK